MPTPTDHSEPHSDSPVDFSKLGNSYQILTELHRDGETPTYLARHNGLNRDVTITVVRAAGDRSYLETFADDAKVLAEKRNPTIVPVIEGRWLDDHTFAIVRARVRGSTLDQLLSAIGTMPEPRVSATLRQVAAALGWARANGVKHRRVSPQSIVFQQPSGKVLLALEPWPDPADDVATIRNLAARMTGGAPVDVSEYLGLLSGGVITDAEQPRPTLSDAIVPVPPIREERGGGGERGDTVVVQQRSGMGFTGRVLTAFVALAAVVLLAVFVVHRRNADNVRVTNTANGVLDSGNGEPAGDSALHSNRLDSIAAAAANAPRDVPPPVVPPQPVTPAPAQPMPMPVAAAPTQTRPSQIQPTAPRPSSVDTSVRSTSSINSGSSGATDACSSPAPSDQRRCLMTSIQDGDRALNSVYQQVIAALRKQAGVADSDPDPSTVQDLRDSQRRWLEQRDDACHNVGDGPLYAHDRAACYADKAAERVKELQARLDSM